MEPQVLIAFFVMSVLIICVPGPDWAYSIAAGLAPKNYGPSIAGICSGYLVHTLLLAVGTAAIIAASPRLLMWISLAGGLYLVWLGVQSARTWRSAGYISAGETAAKSPLKDFLRGIGISGLTRRACCSSWR